MRMTYFNRKVVKNMIERIKKWWIDKRDPLLRIIDMAEDMSIKQLQESIDYLQAMSEYRQEEMRSKK